MEEQEHRSTRIHVENVAKVLAELSPEALQNARGEHGPCIQVFAGRRTGVWLNHLTGESGLVATVTIPQPVRSSPAPTLWPEFDDGGGGTFSPAGNAVSVPCWTDKGVKWLIEGQICFLHRPEVFGSHRQIPATCEGGL